MPTFKRKAIFFSIHFNSSNMRLITVLLLKERKKTTERNTHTFQLRLVNGLELYLNASKWKLEGRNEKKQLDHVREEKAAKQKWKKSQTEKLDRASERCEHLKQLSFGFHSMWISKAFMILFNFLEFEIHMKMLTEYIILVDIAIPLSETQRFSNFYNNEFHMPCHT